MSAAPAAWRNAAAELSRAGFELPLPSRGKGARPRPVSLAELSLVTSTEAARIELLRGPYGRDPWIEIPARVLELYRGYRPTPLYRSRGLETLVARGLGKRGLSRVQLWIKDESGNPGGSHKINTALPQAHYVASDGIGRVVTDTGAGQWGAAVSIAAREFGLGAVVFMTAQSHREKPGRVALMRRHGAEVHSSPSALTAPGRAARRADSAHPGSLGLGMSEAFSLLGADARLMLGCMSYYAALHQSVIGAELETQLRERGLRPDALVACVGGGSNFCGLTAPWLALAARGRGPRLVAAEAAAIPVLSQGEYRWDHQDHGGLMPRLLMYTLGHRSVPPRQHAGGLRYHGKNPLLSLLCHRGLVKVAAIPQADALSAGRAFRRAEGRLPAPESAHALRAAMREAAACELRGERALIVALLTGDGALDAAAYRR